jgi:hypothetical protein
MLTFRLITVCQKNIKEYYANRILLLFPVNLKGGETWSNDISLKFTH